MFGDPATNPNGWNQKPLGDVISAVEAGWSAAGEPRQRNEREFGVLKVSAVTSGRFLPTEHKAVAEVPESRVLVTPRRGDLLFSRANTRELIAASCIVEKDYPRLFLSDKLWRLVPQEQEASTVFLKELFWRESVRDQFRARSSGSSGSMLNISQEAMLRVVVPIPPYPLQKQFEESSWELMETIRYAGNAGAKLERLFELILQQGFAGQLTAEWRMAHIKELLVEMAQQARVLNLPLPNAMESAT
jgi:type I restriction enzyme S subunit